MNLLIIQARLGSTRLPGKVLMKISGKPLLELLVERVSKARTVNQILIATTTNKEDDAIETFCAARGLAFFRGSEWDVLERFYKAALPYKPQHVIRITADCPLHSYKVVDYVVQEFERSGTDYFSNSNHEPEIIEDGFDTEVFSFQALEIAHREAKLLSEREHVTPYIKNSGRFRCGWKAYNPEYKFKLSVDSPGDFAAVSTIFKELQHIPDFTMEDVIRLLKEKPEILSLNKDSTPNAGYIKSINNDKTVK